MEISSPPRSPPGSPERPGLIARLQREGADWFLPSVLAPYLLTRAALVGAAEVATLAIPHATAQGPAAPPLTASWTAPFLGWDAYWYLRIAAEWYSYQPQAPPTEQQSVVFFPLYPLLVRAFSVIVGGADALPFAALVVANLGAIVGLTLLFRLVEGEFGRAIAQRTIYG